MCNKKHLKKKKKEKYKQQKGKRKCRFFNCQEINTVSLECGTNPDF